MRGPPTMHYRAGARPMMPQNEATARTYTHPAPYGGWNARGNLANMPATDAVQMDNFFPGVQDVQLRLGCLSWVTDATDDIETLIVYNGPSSSKMFASTDAGIYDVTSAGTFGAASVVCTNGQWSYVNFTTTGGSYIVLANGTDAVKAYDGTTWTTPAITVATPANLNYVTSHQKRLWFIEKNTMKLWYLPVESIAGAATAFPVGALFKKGGYIVAIGTWTIDSGNGANDLFVIVTSNGEIAVYQGTDPASSTTWALVGTYNVARPLGSRCLIDFGGDLLYLSKTGLIPLSKLSQSVSIDRTELVSYKIDGAFLTAAEDYGSNYGWTMEMHKNVNLLIVNVPISSEGISYQFAMNTITKAWARFLNWNAVTWAVIGDDIFFAGGTKVTKAWAGTSDYGAGITGTCLQAYSPLGMRAQKNISLARPHIGLSGSAQISYALDADFRTFQGQSIISYVAPSGAPLWDTSVWDGAVWDGINGVVEPKWLTVPGDLGYLHSFRLQVSSSTSSFTWTSTDFAYRPAGIL